MFSARNLAFFLLLFILVAPEGRAEVPYGGDRQTYDGTKIYRIGDYSHRIREFQDYAILNAIDHLLAAGVARPAIRQITIEPDKGAGVLSLGSGFPLSTTYRLWIKVDGCEANIFMRAASSGRLTSVSDRGRCLKA